MSGRNERIEMFFENMARTLYTHRFKTLVILVLCIGAMLWRLPHLTVDTNADALLKNDDPDKIVYNEFREQFGQDRMVVIAITSDHVFSEDFFLKLKSLHDDLEKKVPYVDEVTSLINARHTFGDADRLVVEDLMDGWPEERAVDFAALKNLVLNNPTYLDQIISPDGRTTAVVIKPEVYHVEATPAADVMAGFEENAPTANPATPVKQKYLSQEQNEELVNAISAIIKSYEAPDFSMAYTGTPVVLSKFNQYTMKDMRLCFGLNMLVNLVFLALLFRRVSGVILPQIVVFTAAFSALGLMAWFNVPVKMTTTVLPAFLVCVGVADSVHILSIFYKQMARGLAKKDAISYAIGHSGLAVVLTSLTTAAGLISFATADLVALAELGYFAAAGVMLALLYTLIMLPVMVAFSPVKIRPVKEESGERTLMDRILLMTGDVATRHPFSIIIVSLILFAVSYYYVFNLRYSDFVAGYFPTSMKVRQDIDLINDRLNGALNLEIIIDTGRENGVYEPDILNRIERLARDLETMRFAHITVGKVTSINDILKETHQALNENRKDYYVVPQDYDVIAQELFLFENSGADDLEKIVDTQFSKTRVTAKIHWVDSVYLNHYIGHLNRHLEILFGDRAKMEITGMSALMARSITAALDSMARSYLLAFVIIGLMMIYLSGDLKTGLFSMIPNFIPIVMTLGIMGALNVPLDMTSLMIASIAMGLVVDDTVHFIYNFRKYYLKTGNAFAAVNLSLSGVGRAMVITSVVLACGFLMTIFANLSHTFRFGIFTAIPILFALLADFLLMPALMIVITGSHNKPEVLHARDEVVERFYRDARTAEE